MDYYKDRYPLILARMYTNTRKRMIGLLLAVLCVYLLPTPASNHDSTPEFSGAVKALGCNMSSLMQASNFASIVSWSYNPLELSVGACNFSVIDAKFARECIARSSPAGIVLAGDSLTRYQYLNLVNFLVHDNWASNISMPNENEHKFSDWKQFYRVTNERMGGHEICDCYRGREGIVENRYFVDQDVRVSYRQVFGKDNEIYMHDLGPLNLESCQHSRCNQSHCLPGDCALSVPPVTSLGHILDHGFLSILQSYPASDVFFNAGLWWISNTWWWKENGFANHLGSLLEQALLFHDRSPGVRLNWKSTTASQTRQHPDAFAGSLIKSGAFHGVYDTRALTADVMEHAELMWDTFHFVPEVYAGLNKALISYICSLETGETGIQT